MRIRSMPLLVLFSCALAVPSHTLFLKATTTIVGFIEGLRRQFAPRFDTRVHCIACNQIEGAQDGNNRHPPTPLGPNSLGRHPHQPLTYHAGSSRRQTEQQHSQPGESTSGDCDKFRHFRSPRGHIPAQFQFQEARTHGQ